MEKYQEYVLKLERELKYRNYSPKTIRAYSNCIKFFLKYIKKDFDNISRDEIIDFLLNLQSEKKAPKTINLYKESIKFFYKEILKQEKDLDIKFSREAKKLPIILSNCEIKKILDYIKNEKHKFIIAISY